MKTGNFNHSNSIGRSFTFTASN